MSRRLSEKPKTCSAKKRKRGRRLLLHSVSNLRPTSPSGRRKKSLGQKDQTPGLPTPLFAKSWNFERLQRTKRLMLRNRESMLLPTHSDLWTPQVQRTVSIGSKKL